VRLGGRSGEVYPQTEAGEAVVGLGLGEEDSFPGNPTKHTLVIRAECGIIIEPEVALDITGGSAMEPALSVSGPSRAVALQVTTELDDALLVVLVAGSNIRVVNL